MNKTPLKSEPVGQGTGKTAAELNLSTLAHETNSYLAYESITRAHTGEPNVLISRKGYEGETAGYGDGFYTRMGTKGARNTGLTIRFTIDPNAREGSDFTRTGDYIVIKNKNAIRVIPESLNFGWGEYFEFLSSGQDFDESDLGIIHRLRKRLGNKKNQISPDEMQKIYRTVQEELKKENPSWTLVSEWLELPEHAIFPDLLKDKPLFKEIIEIRKDLRSKTGDPQEYVRTLESHMPKVHSAQDFLELVRYNKAVASTSLNAAVDAFVMKHAEEFLSRKPSPSVLNQLMFGVLYHNDRIGEFGTKVVRAREKLFHSSADIARAFQYNVAAASTTLNHVVDANLVPLAKQFVRFNPTPKEVADFRSRFYAQRRFTEIVVPLLLANSKSADEFLQRANYNKSAASTEVNHLMDQTLIDSLKKMESLNPTVAEWKELEALIYSSRRISEVYQVSLATAKTMREFLDLAKYNVAAASSETNHAIDYVLRGYSDKIASLSPTAAEFKELKNYFYVKKEAIPILEKLLIRINDAKEMVGFLDYDVHAASTDLNGIMDRLIERMLPKFEKLNPQDSDWKQILALSYDRNAKERIVLSLLKNLKNEAEIINFIRQYGGEPYLWKAGLSRIRSKENLTYFFVNVSSSLSGGERATEDHKEALSHYLSLSLSPAEIGGLLSRNVPFREFLELVRQLGSQAKSVSDIMLLARWGTRAVSFNERTDFSKVVEAMRTHFMSLGPTQDELIEFNRGAKPPDPPKGLLEKFGSACGRLFRQLGF